jgi:hypothetical protein
MGIGFIGDSAGGAGLSAGFCTEFEPVPIELLELMGGRVGTPVEAGAPPFDGEA